MRVEVIYIQIPPSTVHNCIAKHLTITHNAYREQTLTVILAFFASPAPHQRYALHEHRATVILASFSFLVSPAPAASAIHAEVIIGRRVSQHFRKVPSHSYQRGPFFSCLSLLQMGCTQKPNFF